MADPQVRVFIRDSNYERVGELTAWLSLKAVPVFNGIGTWSMEVNRFNRDGSLNPLVALITRSSGIIITWDGVTVFSGPVRTEYTKTAQTLRVAGYCDNVLLLTPARPTPALATAPFPDEFDVRTGVASTIMRQLVDVNIGPSAPVEWEIPALALAADPVLGTSITSRARLDPLITLLRELALTPYAGGLGFKILQSDVTAGTLTFQVYAPQDRQADAKFGIELGSAQDFEDVQTSPEANYFYVAADDGLGADRTIIEGGDAVSIAELGKIARYIPAHGVTDPGELNQRLAEALAGAVSSRRVKITPFDVPVLAPFEDWNLGDLVTFVVDGESFVELIREIEIDLTTDRGAVVVPMIGEAGTSGADDPLAGHIAAVEGRLDAWQRLWNVPPDSIKRSELHPVLKPPIGEMKWLAGPNVPAGHLAAHGQAVSRSTYALLFAEIGTTWGAGNGTTTFNVPDGRGRVPLGVSGSHALGTTGGAETASGPAHTHPGSHSHPVPSHDHTGAAHTHPGSHSHGVQDHVHDYSIDHNHPAADTSSAEGTVEDLVTTGGTQFFADATHSHEFDMPNYDVGNLTTDTSEIASGPDSGDPLTSTEADTNVFAASYTGNTGGTSGLTTSTDSNAHAASYSGSIATMMPFASLTPVIYAAA